MSRDKTIAFHVTAAEKRRFREAASKRGLSMAELARRQALSVVRSNTDETTDMKTDDPYMEPLADFIESGLAVAADDSQPVAKSTVYEWYREFCDRVYPEHKVESQHKVSREVANVRGVETGRRYLQENPSGSDNQTRCFLNIRRVE